MGLYFGGDSVNMTSILKIMNISTNEYVYENKTETVQFPRKPATETTDYLFTDVNAYKESNLEFSCYESSSSIEGMSKFFDNNEATNGNMINGLRFKFDKPVLMEKMYVRNSGGYNVTLKGTNNPEIMDNVYSDLWDIIYTGGAENYEVELNPTQSYQYYCLTKNSGYKTIYELKFYAITGNVSCTLKSASMTPTINCYAKNYMEIVTQDWYNGSDIIPSQTLLLKPFEDGGHLVNYEDNGSAVNLGLYLVQPTGEVITKSFVQPVLSANGTMGGDAFAVMADGEYDSNRPAWKAFDGNIVMNNASYDQWHSGYGQPHWIKFYNPEPLNISKLTIYNGASNVLPLDWEFQYSDTNTDEDWHTLTSGTNTELTQNGVWEFDIENSGEHQYYRFRTTSGSGSDTSYLGITEIQITGSIKVQYNEPMYVLSPDDSFTLEGFSDKTLVTQMNIPAHIYYNGSDWVMGDERIEVHPIVKPEVLPDVVIPE